jgi:hypothetical protein
MKRRRRKKEAKVVAHCNEWSLGWFKWIMHKSHACTSICVFSLIATEAKKKKEKEENVYWYFIGRIFLTDWWIFFYRRFLFLSNRKRRCMIWAVHSPEKFSFFREWCKLESFVIFMRTWTLITQYDCYSCNGMHKTTTTYR